MAPSKYTVLNAVATTTYDIHNTLRSGSGKGGEGGMRLGGNVQGAALGGKFGFWRISVCTAERIRRFRL